MVGGTQNGAATIWVVEATVITEPVLRFTYSLPGYATVAWIGMGPSGGNANKGECYAVVKTTPSGTDKLTVVALGLHY